MCAAWPARVSDPYRRMLGELLATGNSPMQTSVRGFRAVLSRRPKESSHPPCGARHHELCFETSRPPETELTRHGIMEPGLDEIPTSQWASSVRLYTSKKPVLCPAASQMLHGFQDRKSRFVPRFYAAPSVSKPWSHERTSPLEWTRALCYRKFAYRWVVTSQLVV